MLERSNSLTYYRMYLWGIYSESDEVRPGTGKRAPQD